MAARDSSERPRLYVDVVFRYIQCQYVHCLPHGRHGNPPLIEHAGFLFRSRLALTSEAALEHKTLFINFCYSKRITSLHVPGERAEGEADEEGHG